MQATFFYSSRLDATAILDLRLHPPLHVVAEKEEEASIEQLREGNGPRD